jgi:predicted nucleotide-binding protein (sugar kinase/HSP70/actin superfamily)
MKIGIPKGLLYYSYYPLMKSFYEELGAEIVYSANTNKNILDYGVKLCVDEACLPVKIHHGHVKDLADKVDAVFVPRIMSISKNEYICPKFCGLPEMIKNSIPNLPFIIDTEVNLRKSKDSIYKSIIHAASIITRDRTKIMAAYSNALHSQLEFENKLKTSGDFDSAAYGHNYKNNTGTQKIALLGHPYNIYDSFINMDIKSKLIKQGYQVITPEMIDEDRINRNANKMPKRHFWTFGRKIIGIGLSFIENHDIDGIIYLSSFGCGIDSLMEDYLERHIKRDGKIPYMKLTLDEHSGEAGLNTRLEAFIDMVKWREENEGNISTYGRNIRSSKKLS